MLGGLRWGRGMWGGGGGGCWGQQGGVWGAVQGVLGLVKEHFGFVKEHLGLVRGRLRFVTEHLGLVRELWGVDAFGVASFGFSHEVLCHEGALWGWFRCCWALIRMHFGIS